MMEHRLSEDELDYLRELANLAMGNAGASLSELLDVFIELSVPELRFVKAEHAAQDVAQMLGLAEQSVSAVRLGFRDFVCGEALLLYSQADLQAVTELMQDDTPFSSARERAVLLDVSGILGTACLNGLAESVHESIIVSAPTILCQAMRADELLRFLFDRERSALKEILIIKITFKTENNAFRSELLLFFDEASIQALQKKVQDMLSAQLG